MSKTDTFRQNRIEIAGSVLQGLLSNPKAYEQFENNEEYKEIGNFQKVVATASIMYADMILKEIYSTPFKTENLTFQEAKTFSIKIGCSFRLPDWDKKTHWWVDGDGKIRDEEYNRVPEGRQNMYKNNTDFVAFLL